MSSNHLSPRTLLPLFLLTFGLFVTSRISAAGNSTHNALCPPRDGGKLLVWCKLWANINYVTSKSPVIRIQRKNTQFLFLQFPLQPTRKTVTFKLILTRNLKVNCTPTLFTCFSLTMTFPLLSRQNVFFLPLPLTPHLDPLYCYVRHECIKVSQSWFPLSHILVISPKERVYLYNFLWHFSYSAHLWFDVISLEIF